MNISAANAVIPLKNWFLEMTCLLVRHVMQRTQKNCFHGVPAAWVDQEQEPAQMLQQLRPAGDAAAVPAETAPAVVIDCMNCLAAMEIPCAG